MVAVAVGSVIVVVPKPEVTVAESISTITVSALSGVSSSTAVTVNSKKLCTASLVKVSVLVPAS